MNDINDRKKAEQLINKTIASKKQSAKQIARAMWEAYNLGYGEAIKETLAIIDSRK